MLHSHNLPWPAKIPDTTLFMSSLFGALLHCMTQALGTIRQLKIFSGKPKVILGVLLVH